MKRLLDRRLILIVEDETLIALDLSRAFESEGATVRTARSVSEVREMDNVDVFDAAVLDHRLRDGEASAIYKRLWERNIPFIVYTGLPHHELAGGDVPIFIKPLHPRELIKAVERLLREQPTLNPLVGTTIEPAFGI